MEFCVCTHRREDRHNWLGQCLDCRCGHEKGEFLTQRELDIIFDAALGERRVGSRDNGPSSEHY